MGWIEWFVVKNSDTTSWPELLHHFTPFCTQFCKATKTHQNMSLGSNGFNPVCSLRKIMTRLRGTNFYTSSARFAPSFERQRNGPKCIQIVQYTPKQEFGVQWGGSVVFVVKKSDGTSWHELLHQFGTFCTVFCNATEWSQMHQNSMKRYET